MNTKFSAIALSLICLMGCSSKNNFRSLDVEAFDKAISNPNTILIDLRSAADYAASHIANAVNIDANQAACEERLIALLPTDKPVALYAQGEGQCDSIARFLVEKGFETLILSPGFDGWGQANKEVTQEEVDLFKTVTGTPLKIYAVKHGSVKMQVGDKWVYVDPVTTAALPATDFSSMPKADLILVTHEHPDHYDSTAISQLTKEGTILITNPATHDRFATTSNVLKNGDTKVLFNSWSIKAVPAYNTSADKQQFHPQGRDNGYIVSIDNLHIYFAGDLEVIPELKDVSNIDIAFLPCNLPYTMNPEQLAEAANIIKPKVLFPYHYGETDLDQVAKLLDGSGIDVRIRRYK